MSATLQLRKSMVETYEREYSNLITTFRDLDSKAQGAITTTGIFLAGVFAFVRQLSSSDSWSISNLIVATSLLVLTIGFAIFCIFVRKIAPPPTGIQAEENIRLLIESVDSKDEELAKRLPDFYGEQEGNWRICVTQAEKAIQTKATSLRCAHSTLALAIVVVAITTFQMVLRSPNEGQENGAVHRTRLSESGTGRSLVLQDSGRIPHFAVGLKCAQLVSQ